MENPSTSLSPYQMAFTIAQSQTFQIGGQTSLARIVGSITATGGSAASQILIRVLLQGSSVNASDTGSMSNNDEYNQGTFIDQLTVTITPSQPSTLLIGDGPTTQVGGSSTTTSNSCGFNASAGTFSEEPTASVGFSETYTTSFSLNLSQMQINNISSTNSSCVQYFLASSNGAAYSSPNDLLDEHYLGFHCTLYSVPSIAYDNIPLLNIASFTIDPKDANSTNSVKITVSVRYSSAGLPVDGYDRDSINTSTLENTFTFTCPMDLGQLSNAITCDDQNWVAVTPVQGSSNWVENYIVQYAIGWLAADGTVVNFTPWSDPIGGAYWSMPTLILPTSTNGALVGRQVWRLFKGGQPQCVGTINDTSTVRFLDNTP